jgi:DNA-binding response OmpR family regulator
MSERRILLVEDDHDLADMMSWVLTSAGFHVTTARDGAAGLQALERLPHCIVILDLVMPDVDGVEFRRRQQNHPVARAAPVLVVSGRHDAARLAEGMGVAGFLPKPFTPDDLVEAVSRLSDSTAAHP